MICIFTAFRPLSHIMCNVATGERHQPLTISLCLQVPYTMLSPNPHLLADAECLHQEAEYGFLYHCHVLAAKGWALNAPIQHTCCTCRVLVAFDCMLMLHVYP